jgi:AraC-like DNA-binding protein
MRAAYEAVEPNAGSSLRCWRAVGESFNARWHFHPEIEFMFVERSCGLRFVGDNVEPFHEGDLVMIGPNLPHVWLNSNLPQPTPSDHSIAICVQFRENFLGESLWRAPEFSRIAVLLRRASIGIHFTGPELKSAAGHLQNIAATSGPAQLAELILLLDLLAGAQSIRLLASGGYVPDLNRHDAARIAAVCRYIHENLSAEIYQPAAAKIAGLKPATFCSFFREKVGRTFSSYVTQLRIARAIHLMVEEEMTVSEAAFTSGFNNLSNFNQHFRAQKGMSPSDYLHSLQDSRIWKIPDRV